MNINVMDVLTLSDKNKYIVANKAFYGDKDYLFLIDLNNKKNVKFCYQRNDEIVESTDKELNTKLLQLFYNEIMKLLEKDNK